MIERFRSGLFLLALLVASPPVFAEINPLLEHDYPDLENQLQPLSQWRGKVLFINFWASWCPPCIHEIPVLADFQKERGAEGMQVVGIGLDERRKLSNAARTLGVNYPILYASPAKTPNILAKWGDLRGVLPFTAVFNAEGKMILRHTGPLTRKLLDEYFEEVRASSR